MPPTDIEEMTPMDNDGVDTGIFLPIGILTPSPPIYFGIKVPSIAAGGDLTSTIYFLGVKHALP